MKHLPVVTSSWLSPFVHTLGLSGAPIDNLLDQAKVPRLALEQKKLLIAEPPLWAFLELSATAGGIDGLGFRSAQSFGIDRLGDFGKMLDRAINLKKSVDIFASASPISGYGIKQLRREVYFVRRGSGIKRGAWQVEQYIVTIMVQAVRCIAGPDWTPEEVLLQVSDPTGIEESHLLGRSAIHVGQPFTGIKLSENLLAQENFLPTGCDPETNDPDWKILSQILEPYIVDGHPDEEFAAEICNVSARTLRRRLQESGVSFREVLASALFNKAKRMIADPEKPLIDIAFSLGYKDHGSFSRAFKSWTGLSPSAYRSYMKSS